MTDYRVNGATGEWEVVIGLEVRAQIMSSIKLPWAEAIEERAEFTAKAELWW